MKLNTKHVFITGTDTGVGKSIFSSFLALYWNDQGKKVAISKPVQTGAEKDTVFLSMLTGGKVPVFNSYSFNLPAAPGVAAKHENREIDIEKIILDIRKLEQEFEYVIIEGIGGIAVPITGNYLVADLIKDLNYPAIIVASPSLGTINHTILTIEFAKQKELDILGFVISGFDEDSNDPVIKTASEVISQVTSINCLMKLKQVDKSNLASVKFAHL